jgi:thiopeptide-type bacteriocin biosynthesis protein
MALAEIERAPLGVSPRSYRAVARRLEDLPAPVELNQLFQVDMVKGGAPTVSQALLAEVKAAVALLHRLSPRLRRPTLAQFCATFDARYAGREVPLCEVLDDETGIPLDPPRRRMAGGADPAPESEEATVGPYFGVLLRKLEQALSTRASEIVLEDADLDEMAPPGAAPEPLPDCLTVLCTVLAASPAALAAEEVALWIHAISGPSGANLLARFCHSDPTLAGRVRTHLEAEAAQAAGAIFAEVVHLPTGRIGNAIVRPLLRDWEIPYLGRSGAPAERQIAVDDLLVSVRHGRAVLRSRRHGREVHPRLTTAHDFWVEHNLPLYRFLCALQRQGVAELAFTWGALEAASFLPRVRYRRTILYAARWRLSREELDLIGSAQGDEQFACMQVIRERRRLPRWITVDDGDNQLPVDLDNVLSVEAFVRLAKQRGDLTVAEFLASGSACAAGPEGRFTHELVIPLVSCQGAEPARAPAPSPVSNPVPALPRSLPPGSEWLFAKVYAGPATVDLLLRQAIAPLIAQAVDSGDLESWFFIRYSDPDYHLRLRLQGRPARLRSSVLPPLETLAARAIEEGLAWRFQLDTYEREVERYGGEAGLLLSERLFRVDSDSVLAVLQMVDGDGQQELRWRLALAGLDLLLGDLDFSLEERYDLLDGWRQALAADLSPDGALARELGERFRRERRTLDPLLDRRWDLDQPLGRGCALIAAQSPRRRELGQALRQLARDGGLDIPLADLTASHLHMQINRMLCAPTLAEELMIYDFLARLYDGRIARKGDRRRANAP